MLATVVPPIEMLGAETGVGMDAGTTGGGVGCTQRRKWRGVVCVADTRVVTVMQECKHTGHKQVENSVYTSPAQLWLL